MAKIDIISGFLGAGKTTLIKKLISEAFQGEKLVIIENEFGEIGIEHHRAVNHHCPSEYPPPSQIDQRI